MYFSDIALTKSRSGSSSTRSTTPLTSRYRRWFSGSTMERAMCGSRSRLRSFWRVLVWLNLTCSPSQPNHTGLFCGSPWGLMVATCATASLSRRSWTLSGITDRSPLVFSVLSPSLVIPALGGKGVLDLVLLAAGVVTRVPVAHGLELAGGLL